MWPRRPSVLVRAATPGHVARFRSTGRRGHRSRFQELPSTSRAGSRSSLVFVSPDTNNRLVDPHRPRTPAPFRQFLPHPPPGLLSRDHPRTCNRSSSQISDGTYNHSPHARRMFPCALTAKALQTRHEAALTLRSRVVDQANGPQRHVRGRFAGRSARILGDLGGADRRTGNSGLAADPRERRRGGRTEGRATRRALRSGRSCPRCGQCGS